MKWGVRTRGIQVDLSRNKDLIPKLFPDVGKAQVFSVSNILFLPQTHADKHRRSWRRPVAITPVVPFGQDSARQGGLKNETQRQDRFPCQCWWAIADFMYPTNRR